MISGIKTAYWNSRKKLPSKILEYLARSGIFANKDAASRALLILGEKIFRENNPQLEQRHWSNNELRLVAPLLTGSAINVSGWKDEDKEGNYYKDYFTSASEYFVSNIPGVRGASGRKEEIHLDLQAPLPDEYNEQFDTSFCHTVLEHVKDPLLALDNLCKLTKENLILVVPFVQVEHFAVGSYLDYFRFTPIGLNEHLRDRGFETVRITTNKNPVLPTYVFCFAVRSEYFEEKDYSTIVDLQEVSLKVDDQFKPISNFGTFMY